MIAYGSNCGKDGNVWDRFAGVSRRRRVLACPAGLGIVPARVGYRCVRSIAGTTVVACAIAGLSTEFVSMSKDSERKVIGGRKNKRRVGQVNRMNTSRPSQGERKSRVVGTGGCNPFYGQTHSNDRRLTIGLQHPNSPLFCASASQTRDATLLWFDSRRAHRRSLYISKPHVDAATHVTNFKRPL